MEKNNKPGYIRNFRNYNRTDQMVQTLRIEEVIRISKMALAKQIPSRKRYYIQKFEVEDDRNLLDRSKKIIKRKNSNLRCNQFKTR